MTKYLILPVAAAGGIINALDAQSRAARKRAGFVGGDIAALEPPSWNGAGPVPHGQVVPLGLLYEPGGTRVALVGTEAFADGNGNFAGALDELPGDWA